MAFTTQVGIGLSLEWNTRWTLSPDILVSDIIKSQRGPSTFKKKKKEEIQEEVKI